MIEELGVGIVCSPDSQQFLESNYDLLDYLEIEPQTFWFKGSELGSYFYQRELGNYLKEFGKPFLFHGVGFPIGSSFQDSSHSGCLQEMIIEFNPKWMSEHLSFNTFDFKGNKLNTNFLLPPLQNNENCKVISETIRKYKSIFEIPFAFETSTNYLKKQLFEIEDGDFVSQIAEISDSYILLDIHNIWANHLNGRQSIFEFIDAIPLDRVLEIHLAGGFWFNNYYLDSHSGIASQEILEVSSKIIRQLPNLKSITFEILPDYFQFAEEKSIRNNIEAIKRLWDIKGKDCNLSKKNISKINSEPNIESPITAVDWENTLGALSLRMSPQESKYISLFENDAGLAIIQELIDRFRASALLSTMKFTCSYIIQIYGSDYLLKIFEAFWREYPPKLFPIESGLDFAIYLIRNKNSEIFNLSYMEALISYEYQSILSVYNSKDIEYLSEVNPLDILDCLLNKNMEFSSLKKGNFQIRIEKGNILSELNKMNANFHS